MNPLRRRLILVVVALAAGALLFASAASAAAPHWTILTQAGPADFHPGDMTDIYEVVALNDGNAAASPNATITDVLPEGLTVTSVEGGGHFTTFDNVEFACESKVVGANPVVTCTDPEGAPAGAELVVKIDVEVPADASGTLSNLATISGGGAAEATWSTSTPVTPTDQPVPYGATAVSDVVGADGSEATQAGSHPFDLTTLVAFNPAGVVATETCGATNFGHSTPGCMELAGNTEDVEVQLPPGLLGNPNAVSSCAQTQFNEDNGYCPVDTQVGFTTVRFFGSGTANQSVPVYNIEPPAGQPAEFGFTVGGVGHVPIFFHLRSDGDYGLTTNVNRITEFITPRAVALSIWGVPADPVHDPLRIARGCEGCASDAQPEALLSMPTSCGGTPLSIQLLANSWQEPNINVPSRPSLLSGTSGCNQLEFEPTLEARPTTNVADAPSGLHVDIKVPQPESPQGTVEAHLRNATVTLPKGLTLNPASAAGLEGCSPAQFGLTSAEGATPIRTSAEAASCPDAAKLGTVEIDSPLLREHDEAGVATGPHPLDGAVYLAEPFDNPFKSLLALYITVNDPKTGIVIKLAGKVQIGADGQLTTTFEENPQLPFEDFKLDFFGGARAPLRTPALCGTYETTSELTPWSAPESGPPASRSDAYAISAGPGGHACTNSEAAQPNSPSFEAGTASALAGAYSPFALHLHREDGSQNIKGLNVTLPPGLIGKLAGVGECSDSALAAAASKTGAAEQASPSCPAASRIGTVNVGAGAGPSPYYAGGTAYLTGPYKSAPFSIAVLTPAVAGPFDLGTVLTRVALHVNPDTAQVSAVSDPIPSALQGIQLDVRSIDLNLDRNQFTLNPTSCAKMSITGEAISTLNQIAPLSSPFQVGECGRLPFKPKLAIKLKGAVHRRAHPKLIATLTAKPGEANIARSVVKLPPSAFLDNAHIGTICTRVQFAAKACPAASVYGHATALTPLLDQPLTGPVYLRSSSHKLPDLVVDLQGPTTQPIEIALAGKTDSVKGALRNTFEAAPDAPISSFRLELFGGKRGLIEMSSGFCAHPKAAVSFTGHNGRVYDTNPVVASSCKATHKRRGHRAAH